MQTKNVGFNGLVEIMIRAGGGREHRPRNSWISDLVWIQYISIFYIGSIFHIGVYSIWYTVY